MTNEERLPRRILIAGGGSSGWMTAAMLQRSLPDADITLIEASDIPIIGVGESTNLTMRYFLRTLGVAEKPFMQAANGAYKNAIRFANFNRAGGVFYHPFGVPVDRDRVLYSPRAEDQHPTYHLAERNHFTPQFAYAYQIDAGLFGQLLKIFSKRAGVTHIVDRITGATVSENGDIASIQTASRSSLSADLYVDCSGFRSFLFGKTLGVPFRSAGQELLNDRAIAARLPYVSKAAELKTYTNCVALSARWVWEIPLWSRLGTGYVYCSSFLSQSAAEAEYRAYLGEDRVKDLQFNHIEIRAGRHEVAWHRNCVAIGISHAFLEPLESTGLSLTQLSILDLAKALASGASASDRDWFNKRQTELFGATKDFIIAHYALTNHEDTDYWKHIRREVKLPASLAETLAAAGRRSYAPINNSRNKFYHATNWNLILSGMDFFGRSETETRPAAMPAAHRRADRQNLCRRRGSARLRTEYHRGQVGPPHLVSHLVRMRHVGII